MTLVLLKEEETLYVSVIVKTLQRFKFNLTAVSDDGTSRLWDCGGSQCLSVIADISSPINSCDIKSIPSLINPPHTEPLSLVHYVICIVLNFSRK